MLVKKLINKGYEVHTLDVYIKKRIKPQICVFLDIPKININKIYDFSHTKKVVLIREPEMISKRNYDLTLHRQFDYLFTWKNSLIDNKKYFYLHGAKINMNKRIKKDNLYERKLCCLINSNLKSNLDGESYSKRYSFIRWFEKNHKTQFDLYGYKWNKKNILFFGRNIYLPSLFSSKLHTYKGETPNKIETLSNYKFSICFENTSSEPDYISEKIFDCFLANTVPIYLGSPNVSNLLPKNTFIDYREFNSKQALFNFIYTMSKEDYAKYIKGINSFIESNDIKKYTLDSWINSIIKIIEI